MDIQCIITGKPRSAVAGTFVEGGVLGSMPAHIFYLDREKKVHIRSLIRKQVHKLIA